MKCNATLPINLVSKVVELNNVTSVYDASIKDLVPQKAFNFQCFDRIRGNQASLSCSENQ